MAYSDARRIVGPAIALATAGDAWIVGFKRPAEVLAVGLTVLEQVGGADTIASVAFAVLSGATETTKATITVTNAAARGQTIEHSAFQGADAALAPFEVKAGEAILIKVADAASSGRVVPFVVLSPVGSP
jgi:hypothetical protein